MNKSNIAILTTVINFDLYNITSSYFPTEIKKYVIDGRNGMHGIHSLYYMIKKLKGKGIDWLILADEDVVFKKANVVFSIIQKMKDDDIYVSGIRDGGVIKHRQYNPIMVNTFFTIINLKEILKIWNKKEVKRHQYILPDEFKIETSHFYELFDMNSLYEPYYCFFLWLKRNGKKFLYLEAQMLVDSISNSILFMGEEFAYHTWYARSFNVNKKHTERINNVLKNIEFQKLDVKITDPEIFKDDTFYFKRSINKTINRFLNKIT